MPPSVERSRLPDGTNVIVEKTQIDQTRGPGGITWQRETQPHARVAVARAAAAPPAQPAASHHALMFPNADILALDGERPRPFSADALALAVVALDAERWMVLVAVALFVERRPVVGVSVAERVAVALRHAGPGPEPLAALYGLGNDGARA